MNNLIVTGNLVRDCRVGKPRDTSVCNFTIAVNSGYGENKHTEYMECAIWGKKAESNLPAYLLKGVKVLVAGEAKVTQREHEGKHYASIAIFVKEIEFAGGKDPQTGHQTPTPATSGIPSDEQLGADGIPF